jgi:glycine/sarcosine N-methyltransferase
MTYDTFSADYDRFVNWPSRLAVEMPFIEKQLKLVGEGSASSRRVLDAACGTGMHAIALARLGYSMAGADLSAGMVRRARANAAKAGAQVHFETAGFGDLARSFRLATRNRTPERPPFDALLCLGNSLPHVLTAAELEGALNDFAACLRPGGLLLVQNRNFDAVVSRRERWMEPQSYREDEKEWLFLRFYDFDPDGLLTFNILTLKRESQGGWTQQITTTRLRPLRQADLASPVAKAGFQNIQLFGSMAGEPFNPETSGNLILTAIKSVIHPTPGTAIG